MSPCAIAPIIENPTYVTVIIIEVNLNTDKNSLLSYTEFFIEKIMPIDSNENVLTPIIIGILVKSNKLISFLISSV